MLEIVRNVILNYGKYLKKNRNNLLEKIERQSVKAIYRE